MLRHGIGIVLRNALFHLLFAVMLRACSFGFGYIRFRVVGVATDLGNKKKEPPGPAILLSKYQNCKCNCGRQHKIQARCEREICNT